MLEAQYFKRSEKSMSIYHIHTGRRDGRYFVRTFEHRGWDESSRESSREALFAREDTMNAQVEAFVNGLLSDGYAEVKGMK